MSQHQEIETKYLLTKTAYEALLRHFGLTKETAQVQTNTYFDTPDLKIINIYHASLRVREYMNPHTFELTLKTPLKEGRLETNVALDAKAWDGLKKGQIQDAGIQAKLHSWGLKSTDLTIVGSLTTYRHSFAYGQGELFLDESHYRHQVDYEIEYEGASLAEGERVLTALFQQLNIKPLASGVSKQRRALGR